jgi:hypothetical protein
MVLLVYESGYRYCCGCCAACFFLSGFFVLFLYPCAVGSWDARNVWGTGSASSVVAGYFSVGDAGSSGC